MSNVNFYLHRSTLDESLKTKKVFNSLYHLFIFLSDEFHCFCSDINIHLYCFDERISCYTFIVCIKNDAVGWIREELIK